MLETILFYARQSTPRAYFPHAMPGYGGVLQPIYDDECTPLTPSGWPAQAAFWMGE